MNIAPEAPEAYRLFAIHSTDTQKGYRRDESWETTTFAFDNYTPEQFEALRDEFSRIEVVPQKMQSIPNKGLLEELAPGLRNLANWVNAATARWILSRYMRRVMTAHSGRHTLQTL